MFCAELIGDSILAIIARNRIKSAFNVYLKSIVKSIRIYVKILKPILIATKITKIEVIIASSLLLNTLRFK